VYVVCGVCAETADDRMQDLHEQFVYEYLRPTDPRIPYQSSDLHSRPFSLCCRIGNGAYDFESAERGMHPSLCLLAFLYLRHVVVLWPQTHLHLLIYFLPHLDDSLRCCAEHSDYVDFAVPRWVGWERIFECRWWYGGRYVRKTCEYCYGQ
jgi:hypothetical protein